MVDSPKPRLKFLHTDATLVSSKLREFSGIETQELLNSLLPGKNASLKIREDGTVVYGHHRLKVLRDRGVDVDALPREIVPKHDL